jgi:hypothetical protein
MLLDELAEQVLLHVDRPVEESAARRSARSGVGRDEEDPFGGSVTGFSGRAVSFGSSPEVVPGFSNAARILGCPGSATAAPAVVLRRSHRLRP